MIQTAPRIYNIHPLLAGPIDDLVGSSPAGAGDGVRLGLRQRLLRHRIFRQHLRGGRSARAACPCPWPGRGAGGRAGSPVRRRRGPRGPARHDGPDPAARGPGRAPGRRTSRLVPPRSRRGARRADSRQPQRSESAALHGGPGGARPRRASPPPGPARLLRRSGAPLALGRHSGLPLQRRLQGAAGVLARAPGTAARGLSRRRLPGRSAWAVRSSGRGCSPAAASI